LSIIPSDSYLANFNDWVRDNYKGFDESQVLKKFLDPLLQTFDFIMIDLPPSLDRLTINGLAASDYTIAVLQPVPLAFDGLNEFIDLAESIVSDKINPGLDVLGILLTIVDRQQVLDNEFIDLAKDVYGELVFNTIIFRRTRIKQFSADGIQSDSLLDQSTLRPYKNLIEEMFERGEQENIGK
jgi:chromosome partitioning protein